MNIKINIMHIFITILVISLLYNVISKCSCSMEGLDQGSNHHLPFPLSNARSKEDSEECFVLFPKLKECWPKAKSENDPPPPSFLCWYTKMLNKYKGTDLDSSACESVDENCNRKIQQYVDKCQTYIPEDMRPKDMR